MTTSAAPYPERRNPTVVYSMSHIDFKLVGKLQVFSGSESGWIELSFQMKAYIVMSQMYNPTELTNIENRREVIAATALTGVVRVLVLPVVSHVQGSCTDSSQTYTSRKRS